MAPVVQETDAVVIASRDHGESDLIVTLFTRDFGRITTIAKGARKSRKRFVNKLEIFTLLHLSLRRTSPRTLALLEQAELTQSHLGLRQHITAYSAASVMLEVILQATHEGEGDQYLFELLAWGLSSLDAGHHHLLVVMLFLLRCWDILGYRPQLHHCLLCGVPLKRGQPHAFSLTGGGLLCPGCGADRSGPLARIDAETIAFLQDAQDRPLEELAGLRIADRHLYQSLDILHRYGRHLLQREFNSWAMLRRTVKATRTGEDNRG